MKKLKWFTCVSVFIVMLTPLLCFADDPANQLTQAAMENNIQMVNDLIAKGADVNAKSRFGLTALECAVWNGHTELVRLLIEKGADVNEKLDNNETALSIAKSKTPSSHRDEIVQLLIKAGAKESK